MMKRFSRNCVLALLLSSAVLPATTANAYPAPEAKKPYYMGVYLYDYRLATLAEEENVDYYTYLGRHLKILKANGVNTVYLGGVRREHFGRAIKLFAQYGISVIPQLDFAYFKPEWDEATIHKNAALAAEFINQYADEPNILAFSVREEVPHSAINGLSRYYAAILSLAPKARFQLINSNLGAATDIPVPDPVIMGTDRYAFWWENSGGGYRATPGFSLNWVREQADRFYWESAKRGADFSLVVTQGGLTLPASANRIAGEGKLNYPKTREEQDTLLTRIRTFAAEGRMGWAEFDTPQGKRYNVWKYYRLPQNSLKALAWTGVLQGAKSFYIWSYTPPAKNTLELDFKQAALEEKLRGEYSWITLAGRPGVANPQLAEFADASREIRAYENIITRMNRVSDSHLECDEKNVFHSTFMLPGLQGRIIVLHNANIGTWPGNSAAFFKDSDDVRIDGEGNLMGYKAFDKPLDVRFSLKNKEVGIYDVRTAQKLVPANAQYNVSIAPGSGTLLFIGNQEEMQKLQQWMR